MNPVFFSSSSRSFRAYGETIPRNTLAGKKSILAAITEPVRILWIEDVRNSRRGIRITYVMAILSHAKRSISDSISVLAFFLSASFPQIVYPRDRLARMMPIIAVHTKVEVP